MAFKGGDLEEEGSISLGIIIKVFMVGQDVT
jgi:hypothetical protein